MVEQNISHKTFSISEAVSFGWTVTKKNFWFFVAMFFIQEVISYVISFIYQPMLANQDILVKVLGIIILIVGTIINLELDFAVFAIFFKFVDKKKASFKDLFTYFDAKLLWRYFVVSAFLGLGIGIGFLLFIFPGIYFATKYWFANNIYVDKRTGINESFKESAKLTQGIKRKLFLFGLVQCLISIAGILALFVGIFVAAPIVYLSDIYIYRKLSNTLK